MPAEIEPVLLRHPAVHEAAVVPLPDERLGERACAALIAQGRASARRRSPSCRSSSTREGVAKYTWPESIEVFDDFPRTPSLKVVKRGSSSASSPSIAQRRRRRPKPLIAQLR